MRRRALLACFAILQACAATPRPEAMSQLSGELSDVVRIQGTFRPEAQRVLQAHWVQARLMWRYAEEARTAGRIGDAQIWAERGHHRLLRGRMLARALEDEHTYAEGVPLLEELRRQTISAEADADRVRQEVVRLELQLKIQDLEATSPEPATDASFRAAQAEMRSSLVRDAWELCAAARALSHQGSEDDLNDRIASLERTTDVKMQRAEESRLDCLLRLHLALGQSDLDVRSAREDGLLQKVAALTSLDVARDERGVLVALAGPPGSAALPLERLLKEEANMVPQLVTDRRHLPDARKWLQALGLTDKNLVTAPGGNPRGTTLVLMVRGGQ